MTELSLNILDIANNSTRAKAKTIKITVSANTEQNLLTIIIADDGSGMSEELLNKVSDPFATTRTTRKVGMGIPLFKMAAQMSGGSFAITSKLGIGTVTSATFELNHIDRVPLGDLSGSMGVLIGGAPTTNFILEYSVNNNSYVFSTKEVRNALGEDDLSDITIVSYIQDMIKENIDNINGGMIL